MTLWRLEWLRFIRTRRWLAVVGVYVFFGFVGPLLARYLAEIVDLAGTGADAPVIIFPPPVPADGLAQYVSSAMQIGTLVAVIVAAQAMVIDAIPEMGVFLRSRVRDIKALVTPRIVVTATVTAGSFVIGALVAWYETTILIGAPDVGAVVAGTVFGVVFVVFTVALVAASAALLHSVISTVVVSVVVLLVMPIVGTISVVSRWLPSFLAGSLGDLAAGTTVASDYGRATAVTVIVVGLLVWTTVIAQRRIER